MPYRRKDSPIWWASFTGPDGQRVRRSTGTSNKAEAKALEAKWKLETYRQRQWEEQPPRLFDELMLGYLNATADEKRSADKDRMRTRHLRRHFGGRVMNTLQPIDVREYIALRKGDGVRNATINREIALLSSAINYAIREWDWELPNVAKGRKLKEDEGRTRWISREEAELLIQTAESEPKAQHLADFIRLALNTGCRSGELLGLEWRRVNLQERLLFLEADHTKAGKRRSVPLNEMARQAILNRLRFRAKHCPASPWVFAKQDGTRITLVRRSFKTACRRAGIEDFNIHDLRHTCAAWLVGIGVPLAEVRDLLGHASVVVTERYAHLSPDNVRAAVAQLDKPMSRFGHADATQGKQVASDVVITA